MKIAFVVCGNGYGHLKRVCEVVAEIFSLDKTVSVLVLGATHHLRMLNVWQIYDRFKDYAFAFVNAEIEKNVGVKIPANYSVDDYYASFDIARRQIDDFQPETIVSDNLAGILKYYPKTILMGSFLWSDILPGQFPDNHAVNCICELEDRLLAESHPVLLAVADMAMTQVKEKTDFVGLPWFCNRTEDYTMHKVSHGILVTGGGTGIASEQLMAIARHLSNQTSYEVMLDENLYNRSGKGKFSVFDFSAGSFASLSWIVCRPGIGILTDAVKYRIPVCAIDEGDLEIKHNARRICELGMGLQIKGDSYKTLTSAMEECSNDMRRTMNSFQTGGAAKAAAYILNY